MADRDAWKVKKMMEDGEHFRGDLFINGIFFRFYHVELQVAPKPQTEVEVFYVIKFWGIMLTWNVIAKNS